MHAPTPVPAPIAEHRWIPPRSIVIVLIVTALLAQALLVSRSARAQIDLIEVPGATDLAYDELRNRLYIATESGAIARYDLTTETLLDPIVVSTEPLAELSISPDGSALVAVEAPTPPLFGLFWVDLETEAVTSVPGPPPWPAVDAVFQDDGSVYVTGLELYHYDRATDAITGLFRIDAGAGTRTQLAVSPDREMILATSVEEDRNRGKVLIYEPATATLRSRDSRAGATPTFRSADGRFAYAGYLAEFSERTSVVLAKLSGTGFTGTDSFVLPGPSIYSRHSLAIAFSARTNRLYTTWQTDWASAVVAYEISNDRGTLLGVLDASFRYPDGAQTTGRAGRLLILPDDSKLFVAAPDGVRVYDPNAFGDLDGDGLSGFDDNCPNDPNPGQEDTNGTGVGDACNSRVDADDDDIEDDFDNCPFAFNPDQRDTDGRRAGDACNDAEDRDGDEWEDIFDNCPDAANDQADQDLDRIGDVCDPFPFESDHVLAQARLDRDVALAEVDRLEREVSRLSSDLDACVSRLDDDADGVPDANDRCPDTLPAVVVDVTGCSKSQFCESIEIVDFSGFVQCLRADWTAEEGPACRPAWSAGETYCAAVP